MALFGKAIDAITEQDIKGLIDNKVREDRTLDYKETLPGGSDQDKRELRFDVSSFANAAGGLLVYGVKERRKDGMPTGEPDDFNPLPINPDTETQRLEQILQTQIEPRIPGVRIRFLQLGSGGYVGIVKIPRSWLGLHLVRINDSFRFYSRNSSGKYILDVSEMRAGFVAAEEGYQRLRRFRLERLAKIVANEVPVLMPEGPKLVMHITPFSSLEPTIEWNLETMCSDHSFQPMISSGWSHLYNFDGIAKFTKTEDRGSESYVQFFRNGSIEAVVCRGFDVEKKLLSSQGLENATIQFLGLYLNLLKKIGVPEPLALGLSLINVKGYSWHINTFKWGHPGPSAFRENDYIIPEILIGSYEQPCHTILRPAFDRIWNAAGRSGSAYYDDDGNWIAQ
jgi:hypothetical protein